LYQIVRLAVVAQQCPRIAAQAGDLGSDRITARKQRPISHGALSTPAPTLQLTSLFPLPLKTKCMRHRLQVTT
jgi:hypothetical protein